MSRTVTQHDLKPVTRCCVADGVTTLRDILAFKPAFLIDCPFHTKLWREADERDRAREQRKAAR